MKIRITIEYDPDWGDIGAEELRRSMEDEKRAWMIGDVGINDIIDTNGKVIWEIVPGSKSIQCPHCRWGFDPSVILQHIREKH